MNINSVNSIIKGNNSEAFKSQTKEITNTLEVNMQNNLHENNPKTDEISNEKLSEKTIKEAVENANKKLILANRKFEFTLHDETKDIVIKVIDKETDEVVKEIPSEKILDMVAKMMELAGLFIDEKR